MSPANVMPVGEIAENGCTGSRGADLRNTSDEEVVDRECESAQQMSSIITYHGSVILICRGVAVSHLTAQTFFSNCVCISPNFSERDFLLLGKKKKKVSREDH